MTENTHTQTFPSGERRRFVWDNNAAAFVLAEHVAADGAPVSDYIGQAQAELAELGPLP